jgi:hypothetical protein
MECAACVCKVNAGHNRDHRQPCPARFTVSLVEIVMFWHLVPEGHRRAACLSQFDMIFLLVVSELMGASAVRMHVVVVVEPIQ